MEYKPLYENLDTAFVNIAALVRYLRQQEFIGRVHVTMENFEAELLFGENRQLRVREIDRFAGRMSGGNEALQRLFVRAKEPNGKINVFRQIEVVQTVETPKIAVNIEKIEVIEKESTPQSTILPDGSISETAANAIQAIQNKIVDSEKNGKPAASNVSLPTGALIFNQQQKDLIATMAQKETPNQSEIIAPETAETEKLEPPIEKKPTPPQQTPTSPSGLDKQQLLAICGEMLQIVETTVNESQGDFAPLFRQAQSALSDDYPFLEPSTGTVRYANGKLDLRRDINTNVLMKSLSECSMRVVAKASFRAPEIRQILIKKFIEFGRKRESAFKKFAMAQHAERIVGTKIF
ncbi:MAG: hypothetical protein H7Z37_04565 [Pyrinomonadaceae bacterium]|nr:hypothetical protein [Pyrinomonadaceae bacterium]